MATVTEIETTLATLTAERDELAPKANKGNVVAEARLQEILPWISALSIELPNARRQATVAEALADGA